MLLVYGDRNGAARRAAVLAARRLRADGVPARVRAADRLARRPPCAWTVLLVDRSGADAVRELRDGLGIRRGAPSLSTLRWERAVERTDELARRWRWRAALLAGTPSATPRNGARGRTSAAEGTER